MGHRGPPKTWHRISQQVHMPEAPGVSDSEKDGAARDAAAVGALTGLALLEAAAQAQFGKEEQEEEQVSWKRRCVFL